MMLTAETVGPQTQIVIHVDPSFPDRWREQPYCDDIKHLAESIPASQHLFVRIKHRLVEITEVGEREHGEVPMAGWTDQRSLRLMESFDRAGDAFVRKPHATK